MNGSLYGYVQGHFEILETGSISIKAFPHHPNIWVAIIHAIYLSSHLML